MAKSEEKATTKVVGKRKVVIKEIPQEEAGSQFKDGNEFKIGGATFKSSGDRLICLEGSKIKTEKDNTISMIVNGARSKCLNLGFVTVDAEYMTLTVNVDVSEIKHDILLKQFVNGKL